MSDKLIEVFAEPLCDFEKPVKEASDQELAHWRTQFRNHPMRGMLAMEIRRFIREQQKTLEIVEPENLKKVQGKIEGLRMVHGLLQRES